MTKTWFPGDLGNTRLRAAAAVGMNREAWRHVAVAVWKFKLLSISLGLVVLLADQLLGFGHRSACKWRSLVQCYKPCSCMGHCG